ncbi:hypothetical protein ACIQU4_17660 [Streptomyces sp. NPDC090741]|uniref:hypothetical protein n=1 Tax=Streptomyces sp. NPDC090741 TaxID=3365967 RepID=UPI00382B79EF
MYDVTTHQQAAMPEQLLVPFPAADPDAELARLDDKAVLDLTAVRALKKSRTDVEALEFTDEQLRHLQLVLVLVDRGDGHRPQRTFDVVAVLVDVRPRDLPQPPVGEFGKPTLDQLGSVGLPHRRPARRDPGCLRRLQALPDRLAAHPQTRPAHSWNGPRTSGRRSR